MRKKKKKREIERGNNHKHAGCPVQPLSEAGANDKRRNL